MTGQLSGLNSPPPTPGLPLSFSFSHNVPFHSLDSVPDSLFLVLESQVQALHAAATTMMNMVNTCGDTIVACLWDIPRHVREVGGHGVHQGAAVALAVAQRQTGCNLWLMEPNFPEGEERE